MQFDPHHLAALSAVLRLGSFDAAGHALNVTPSAVSQRIKALEDRVGASLILRGPPCTATEIGKRLAKHAEDIALLEAQVLGDITAAAATKFLLQQQIRKLLPREFATQKEQLHFPEKHQRTGKE